MYWKKQTETVTQQSNGVKKNLELYELINGRAYTRGADSWGFYGIYRKKLLFKSFDQTNIMLRKKTDELKNEHQQMKMNNKDLQLDVIE